MTHNPYTCKQIWCTIYRSHLVATMAATPARNEIIEFHFHNVYTLNINYIRVHDHYVLDHDSLILD